MSKSHYQKANRVLYLSGLLFVAKAIQIELIGRHYDNFLAGHFGIEKTGKFLAWKYFWLSLQHNVEAYVKGCDVYLASKAVRHKPYGDFQSLPVPIYWCKHLSMDFVTGLFILTNWKGDSYNCILIIVDWLAKMVHYKPVKITINAASLAKVIIDIIVCNHGLSDSIVTNKGLIFTSKFWLLLCYFLTIKCWLFTAFHPQTDDQTERQKSTIEAYLRAFLFFEQNDWARFLPMAKFANNNAKNPSTSHTPFELNCGYHFWVFYKEDINFCFKSKSTNKWLAELQELMTVSRKNLHHAQKF